MVLEDLCSSTRLSASLAWSKLSVMKLAGPRRLTQLHLPEYFLGLVISVREDGLFLDVSCSYLPKCFLGLVESVGEVVLVLEGGYKTRRSAHRLGLERLHDGRPRQSVLQLRHAREEARPVHPQLAALHSNKGGRGRENDRSLKIGPNRDLIIMILKKNLRS